MSDGKAECMHNADIRGSLGVTSDLAAYGTPRPRGNPDGLRVPALCVHPDAVMPNREEYWTMKRE